MTQWGLDVLFNPSKRHMDEEKQRLQSTREQMGDSSGGKRIDLDSGKVRIKSSRPKAAEDTAEEDTTEEDTVEEDAKDELDGGAEARNSDEGDSNSEAESE